MVFLFFIGVDSVSLTDEQFSYHHAKLFGVFNHIVYDPWCQSSIYLVDEDWNIRHSLAHVSDRTEQLYMYLCLKIKLGHQSNFNVKYVSVKSFNLHFKFDQIGTECKFLSVSLPNQKILKKRSL